ncbi:PRP38-domain-containing protein [Backusella circina FSU 941]|nr:PRP38-domain-containing protein [Backusella circina FSU 941]
MSNKPNNRLETWGNEATMNLNAIIYQNILSSPYFRSLYEKKTFHEIVDEIYNRVYVLAPFLKGTQPSTAFCCLYKMWTLRLTIKQIENMIDHVDSTYIRAIGFLYLRYVCAPAQLWDWFQYYLEDEEEVEVTSGPKPQKMTIGQLCRSLITEQKFQGTMLPRIPVPIARDLTAKLEDYDRENKQSSGHRKDDRSYSKERHRSQSPRRRSRSPRRSRRDDYEDRRRSRDRRDEYDDYERRSRDGKRYRSRSREDDRKRYRSRSRDDDRKRYRSRSRERSRHYSRDSRR